MEDLASLKSTFWTASRLLSEVSSKVSDMRKMEVGTAKCAVSVFRHYVGCSAKERGDT